MKYRNLILILLFVLFLIIAVTLTLTPSRMVREKSLNYSGDVNQVFEIRGVVRALLMDPDFKDEVMITSGMYELAEINVKDQKKLPYEVKNLYIEKYPDNPNKYLGKCVVIKGHLDNDWINKTSAQREKKKRYIYQQLVINADSIEKRDFNECDGYKDVSSDANVTSSAKKVYTGLIERNLRDFPDQGSFDYTINVDMEGESVNESTDAVRVMQIPIVPANNNIWVSFENNIRERIAIEGYEQISPTKVKYLVVTRVME